MIELSGHEIAIDEGTVECTLCGEEEHVPEFFYKDSPETVMKFTYYLLGKITQDKCADSTSSNTWIEGNSVPQSHSIGDITVNADNIGGDAEKIVKSALREINSTNRKKNRNS